MAKDNSKPTAGTKYLDKKELWTGSNIITKEKSTAYGKPPSSKASDDWNSGKVQPPSQQSKKSPVSTGATSSSADESVGNGTVTSSLQTISQVYGKLKNSIKEIDASNYPSDQNMENVRPKGDTSWKLPNVFDKIFKN